MVFNFWEKKMKFKVNIFLVIFLFCLAYVQAHNPEQSGLSFLCSHKEIKKTCEFQSACEVKKINANLGRKKLFESQKKVKIVLVTWQKINRR